MDDREAMRERNRELLARRAGHPPETVEICRDLERRFPGWSVWYSKRDFLDHRYPHYAARLRDPHFRDPCLHASDPEELAVLIKGENERGDRWWRGPR